MKEDDNGGIKFKPMLNVSILRIPRPVAGPTFVNPVNLIREKFEQYQKTNVVHFEARPGDPAGILAAVQERFMTDKRNSDDFFELLKTEGFLNMMSYLNAGGNRMHVCRYTTSPHSGMAASTMAVVPNVTPFVQHQGDFMDALSDDGVALIASDAMILMYDLILVPFGLDKSYFVSIAPQFRRVLEHIKTHLSGNAAYWTGDFLAYQTIVCNHLVDSARSIYGRYRSFEGREIEKDIANEAGFTLHIYFLHESTQVYSQRNLTLMSKAVADITTTVARHNSELAVKDAEMAIVVEQLRAMTLHREYSELATAANTGQIQERMGIVQTSQTVTVNLQHTPPLDHWGIAPENQTTQVSGIEPFSDLLQRQEQARLTLQRQQEEALLRAADPSARTLPPIKTNNTARTAAAGEEQLSLQMSSRKSQPDVPPPQEEIKKEDIMSE